MSTDSLANIEWNLWQDLCKKLKESGAVTEADLKSSTSEFDTPGKMILRAIREWGEARTLLHTTKET